MAGVAPAGNDWPAGALPVAYRRIFVPADNVQTWPRDGQKYLPVEADEFDAWVAAGSAGPTAVRVAEAVYSARLDGDRLVDGHAEWQVELRGDGPAFLPLDDMAIVVASAMWRDDPAPVRLGTWGRGAGPTSYGLEVPRAGTLEFSWHSAPAHRSPAGVEIPLKLPPATTKRLVLELPAGRRPVVDGAVVLETTDVAAPEGTADAEPPQGWRRWTLALEGSNTARVRIENRQTQPQTGREGTLRPDSSAISAGPAPPTASTHEEVSYHVSERGLDVATTFRLSGLAAGLRELEVALPDGLQLASASAAGSDLAWHLAGDPPADGARAVVQLPPSARSGPLTLRLSGWAPLVVDGPWPLPKMRVGGVYWTSGSIDVVVDAPLELRAITPTDCIQTEVGRTTSDGGATERLALESYAPSAGVELVVGRRPAVARARIGATLQVGDPDVAGRLVTRLDVDEGSIHTLWADLEPGWTIEAVETTPAEALGQWYVDSRDGGRVIQVQLSRPVRADRPVTIAVTGRLQRAGLFAPLSAETLGMLKWCGVRLARQWLLIQASEPYGVESIGRLPAVAAGELSEDDRALLAVAADGRLFDLLAAAPDAAARLAPKRGAYDAEIQLDATLADGQLREKYRVVCRPQASRIDGLLVYAWPPLPVEIQWIEQSSGRRLQAEPLPADDPRSAALPAPRTGQRYDATPGQTGKRGATGVGGQLWQLRLPRPATGQVEIAAEAVVPCTTLSDVPLLSLPEAAQQHGRVLVRGSGGSLPAVVARGLTPVPLPTEKPANAAAVCAAYRYDPRQTGNGSGGLAMSIRPIPAGDAAGGIVTRHVAIESFYSSGAAAAHRVTYQLDNRGAASIELRVPAGARLDSVWLDQQPWPQPAGHRGAETVVVPLPPGERFPTVSVCFHTAPRPLAGGRRLEPPLPVSDVPLLAGRWTIWLPEGLAALGPAVRPEASPFDWHSRLFGPFGEGAGGSEQGVKRVSESSLLAPRSSLLDSAPRGWRAWRSSFVAGRPAAVVVANRPATTAWALSLFLISAVGGVWLRCRARSFIWLTAAAAGLCLLLPATYAPLATGALLGLLASLVIGALRRPDVAEAPTASWTRLSAAGAIVLGLALLAADRAAAQPPPDGAGPKPLPDTAASSPAPPAEVQIYRVLVPVDQQGQPVGTKLYVSDELLRRLLPRAADERSPGGRWLVREATYQGELVQRPEGAELTSGTWTMTFDLEVLARDTAVQLPLVRDQARWHASAALDGIPVPLAWDANGQRLAIDVAEPGRYRLAISLEPSTRDEGGRRRVELTVPPLRGAKFRLTYPPALADWNVAGAVADGPHDATPGALVGELDGSGRLVVSWPGEPAAAGAGRGLRIAELRWLSIMPDGVELNVKYVLQGDAERPDALAILADRRWELVDGTSGATAVGADATSDGAQAIHVDLDRAAAGGGSPSSREVLLRFRLRGRMGLGELRLPPLQLTSPGADRRWLAVTTDPSLECQLAGEAVTTGPTDGFVSLWGEGAPAAAPQLVFADAEVVERWRFTVRPHVAQSSIEEVLHVAVGRSLLRLQYQADVEPRGAQRFGLSLSVPDDLSIDDLSASRAGREVPLRWARLSDQRVNVFFDRPVIEPYRLVLSGHMPVDDSRRSAVPHVVWAERPAAAVRTLLYRDERTLVEVRGPEGLSMVPDGPVDLPPVDWKLRHAATYQLDQQAAAAAQMVIRPNDVATDGQSLTTLTREGGAWWAVYRVRGRVTRGKLGVLRLDVPTSWLGPFDVQPVALAGVEVSPAEGGRGVVTVRLPETLGEGQPLELQFRGPLAIAAGQPVEVPGIVPLGGASWHSYLMVPADVDGQPAAWTTSGVASARLPDDLPPPPAAPASHVFHVAATPFHVSLQPPLAPRPSASVPLVDTTALAGPDGGQCAVTQFILVPQGLTQCVLRMPAPWELMRVEVDGQPVVADPLGDRRWNVPLTSPCLPQVLEVVSRCTGGPESGGGVVSLVRPTLLAGDRPIPVELSLWSLCDGQSAARPTVEGAKLVTGLQHAAWRLERLVSVAEAAALTAAQSPPPDDYYWFRPWADVLVAARREALSARDRSGRQGTSAQVTPSTDEQLAAAAARADAWLEAAQGVLATHEAEEAPAAMAPRSQLPQAALDGERWTYGVADGGMDRVTVVPAAVGATPGQVRVVGLVMIAGLALGLTWLVRRPATHDLLWRWPHAAGLLLGLAAWAWLSPSWLGLLVAAGSLAPLLRPFWPGPTFRAEGSTVLQRGPQA